MLAMSSSSIETKGIAKLAISLASSRSPSSVISWLLRASIESNSWI